MSPNLENKLYEKYPSIFKERTLPPQRSLMSYGLAIGDGWYDIMDLLCASVDGGLYDTMAVIDEEGANKFGIAQQAWAASAEPKAWLVNVKSPKVVFQQVKEKFGSIRVYYRLEFDKVIEDLAEFRHYPSLETKMSEYSSMVDGVIRCCETLSLRTCELTGTPGTMHSRNGWRKVLCAERATELGFTPIVNQSETVEE